MFSNIKNNVKKTRNLFFPSTHRKLRQYYAKNYESMAIDENLVLYETRDGNSVVDSPYAMFLSLSSNPKYEHFKHVWVISEKNQGIEESIPKEKLDRVLFVYRNTLDYVKAMLEAKYLITNSTFESFFVKRPGQVYINTWHGTPIKKMGFDIPGALSNSQNVLRNFLMTDYLLSPNAHTSNIFINAYKLDDIYSGEILEGGYPRIDFTLHTTKDDVKSVLNSYGIELDMNKQVILFSPTWKGRNAANVSDDIEQMILETKMLQKSLKKDYQLLIKVHPFAYKKVADDSRIKDILIPDSIDANVILAMTDVLVTDYSSIFFDFLITKKPIVFYAWDKDLYINERGLYLNIDELPGPTAENIEELIEYIDDIENQHLKYKDEYNKFATEMVKYDDGMVTSKYIDYIFEQRKSENLVIRKVQSDKKKILIYPGGMLSNGITASFLNLLNNIDYTKYDVSVLLNQDKRKEVGQNVAKLPNSIRPLYRFGLDILTQKESMSNQRISKSGLNIKNENSYPEIGYQREMNRICANLKFDVAIDFSGYSYFWGRHILSSNSNKKVVFIHSNIKADSMRKVNGKYPMLQGLNSLFSIYKKFDKILSVSPMTRDVNFENLRQYVSKDQMSFVYNTINISDILNHNEDISKNTEQELLHIQRRLLEVKEEREAFLYKNINSIIVGDYSMIDLKKDSHVVQHAIYIFEMETYAKISINHKYVGWVNSNCFINKSVEIYDVKDYHAYGTVSRAYHYPIIKKIANQKSEEEIVTYIKPFKKRYLETTKIAYTSHGKYLKVKYLNEELGWVLATPLMRMHEISKSSLKHLYFYYKMRKQDRKNPVSHTSSILPVEEYGRLRSNQSEVSFWSEPKGTSNAYEISVASEYWDETFNITEFAYVGEKVYAKLHLEGVGFIGYIDKESVIFVNKKINTNNQELDESNMLLPRIDLNKHPVADFDEKLINFIHMGRLSPEKNQESLIYAFSKYHQEYPNSRLYILGKGPLQLQLTELVKDLKMEGKVILLGHIQSPYRFIEKADCFVLPSLYEGQPMVILEALTLGMKVLASNIPANINILKENEEYGLLTEGITVDDIYRGLVRMTRFKGSFSKFDYEKYNQTAINSFYREIE